MSHTIYHILGKKVGCTKDFERRKSEYYDDPKWGPDTQFEIIEVLEGFDDKLAGDREFDWARHFGYKLGGHFKDRCTSERMKKRAINLGSKRLSEIMIKGQKTLGPEGLTAKALKAAKTKGHDFMSKLAHERADRLGKEKLIEIALKGHKTIKSKSQEDPEYAERIHRNKSNGAKKAIETKRLKRLRKENEIV